MHGYTPEYIKHCKRYVQQLDKLDVPDLAETFVALECNVGPWAAFRYYDLISEGHYKVLAGYRAMPEWKFKDVVNRWGEVGFPLLTKYGFKRLKQRRQAVFDYLGLQEKADVQTWEHQSTTGLKLARHLVKVCRADISSRQFWHRNLYEWASRTRPTFYQSGIDRRQFGGLLLFYVEAINNGYGPDAFEKNAVRRWCLGASSTEWHRPCILCAYPLPQSFIRFRPKPHRHVANEGRGSSGETRPSRSGSSVLGDGSSQ